MKRVGHKKYKNSNYNSNNEKSQQSSPKSDRKEKEIILQKEEVVDYQSIEKLYMYSNFFERCKITNNNPFHQTFPPISLNNHPSETCAA